MSGLAVALLVARPGRFREAWRALLLSTWTIGTVHEAEDAASALAALDTHGSDIVLLDAEALADDALTLVDRVRAGRPACPCIVLVRSEKQARAFQGHGLDEILVKGLPATQLFAAVERVLGRPASTSEALEPQ
jgi:DNA-binding NarL/FixJ family response regulator